MYLVRSHRNYYKIVKSIRVKGIVKKVSLKYVGALTPKQFNHLKLLLEEAKEADLNNIITQVKDSNISPVFADKVSLISVRKNVYKKQIDTKLLKNLYLKKNMTIGAIAQNFGVSKDRIREHLHLLGYDAQKRLSRHRTKGNNGKAEFGWIVTGGIKTKTPHEFEIIEKMISWRNKDKLSYQKIADNLTNMGILGHLGASKWDRGNVRRIINRNLSRF